jgi:hypothetical protein
MAHWRQRVDHEERRPAAGRWVAGLALSAVLAVTFIALSLFQITGETMARPALRDALNALVEGDAIVARNYEDLRGRAEASQPGELLELRDYPIAIALSREDVLASSQDDIRRLLLNGGVDRMYDDGTSVLRDDEFSGTAGRFTAAGTVGQFLGFLRRDVHAILGVLTLVLAGISVILAIVLAGLCRGFGRAVALGAATLVASLPLLLGGSAAWLYARASANADSEYLRHEFLRIAQDLAGLPVRNGIVLLLAGAAVLIVGAACARTTDARRT